MEHFITVAVFQYPHEIAVLKSRLELEGISYYFENETMTGVVPMSSLALGGIRLKIHPKDADLVRQLLDDLEEESGNLRIV